MRTATSRSISAVRDAGEAVDGHGARPDHHVVIIGAGLSGLGAAIALKKAGIDGITIFERASSVGGTWRDNTYPGIGVDIPAQAYQFRYALNPQWSRLYAKGDEVLAYVRGIAREYSLLPLIRFNSEVTARSWDEDEHLWRITVNGTETTARFVIVATGPFPEIKPPTIAGLDDFGGQVLWSSAWDHSADLAGKRVAVIGTGASAVQIVPEVVKIAAHLDVYQRTPIWVIPKIDPHTPRVVQQAFAHIPGVQRAVHDAFEFGFSLALVNAVIDYGRIKAPARLLNLALSQGFYRLQVKDKELRKRLTPTYDFGCKRPATSSAYLPTFSRNDVELVTDPIDRITERGIRTRSGAQRDVDVIIMATGFRLFFDPEIYRKAPVTGRDGFDLAEFYQHHVPWNYHGISIPKLPNQFLIFGQYGWLGGTWHSVVEVSSRHIARVIAEADQRGATSVEVSPEAADRWTDRVRGRYDHSLFTLGRCDASNSYYFDHNGESAYIQPISTRKAKKGATRFPLSDYEFTRVLRRVHI